MIGEKFESRDSPQLAAAFKGAMRRLASGVAIITTSHEGHRYGMTVTALMSVSMDPPSLAVGINPSATMYRPLVQRRASVSMCFTKVTPICARLFPPNQPRSDSDREIGFTTKTSFRV
jgi:flavin reductase (DIM6/NTAB) family NADH-FMN oxidoreductase RutF